MSNWQPISTAPRDKPIMLYNGPKARYRKFVGRWNAKFNEWRSEPGGWPCRPSHWQDVPDDPHPLA